jgi:hypothetical protein
MPKKFSTWYSQRITAESRMLVSRMRRIRTVWRAPVVFRACVFDGLVNHLLEFVRGNVGESYAGLADGLMKDAQRTASSMNFERSPFLMPWEPRKVRKA